MVQLNKKVGNVMKNKRIYLLIMFLLVFILNTKFCYAEIYKGKLTGESVYLRSGPGTNYNKKKTETGEKQHEGITA